MKRNTNYTEFKSEILNNNSKLITIRELCNILSISRPTVYRKTRDPKSDFPKPIHISTNAVRFRLSDVEAFIDRMDRKNEN